MFVVILNDGETYTDLDGCEVLEVPNTIEDVDEWVKMCYGTGTPVGELYEDWLDNQ